MPPNRSIHFSIVLLSILFADTSILAQSAVNTTSQRDSPIHASISRLTPGEHLRVRIRDGPRLEGMRVELIGDSGVLNPHRRNERYALMEIDSIWVRHGSFAVLVGTLTAIPCAVYGGLVGHFLVTDADSGARTAGWKGAMVGAIAGAGVCGTPGAILGSFIHRWRLLYPNKG